MGFSDRLTFPASGKTLSAEELSAEVLKALRADATRQTQEEVDGGGHHRAGGVREPAVRGDRRGRRSWRGSTQAPLLQEPIAAAIAYGAGPSSRDQRWMVFDLGGGTLDIAVVSTRNGRLAVLEHQGDNRLGGKDIDRVDRRGAAAGAAGADVYAARARRRPGRLRPLCRALRPPRRAGEDRASAPRREATVELFDLGDDRDGKPIELSLTAHPRGGGSEDRPAHRAVPGAGAAGAGGGAAVGAELDRVLLVGGPTQMPVLRAALESGIGAKLDHSLDPMTVVSRGAALYASTVPRTTVSQAAATHAAQPGGQRRGRQAVRIELSYERASGTPQSPVAGVVAGAAGIHEMQASTPSGGFWTSGWVPVAGGRFTSTSCSTTASRSRSSRSRPATARGGRCRWSRRNSPITFMLPMAAPPLPHTIAVELSTTTG